MITKENIAQLSEKVNALKGMLNKSNFSFEIDTEDVVLGFKKTLKKRTKNILKANAIAKKLTADCGRYISASVRIVNVRMYRDGQLIKSL